MVAKIFGQIKGVDMNIAVIGAGYWGKNLIRTFNNNKTLSVVFDKDDAVLNNYRKDPAYSDVEFGNDYKACLDRWDIAGVVIATPPSTHYDIAKTCLLKGKNVFVEKPMTLDTDHSNELVSLAEEQGCVLMVGHIFLYSPEILKLKEIIHSEDFGDIRYAYTKRLNLGKVQECGVIMDLAPHDVSILDFLFEDHCVETRTTATSHVLEGVEDVAFIDLKYSKGYTAHLHLSWLDPLKVRDTIVVGSKQMAVCDSGTKTISVYNMSVELETYESNSNNSYAQHLLSYTYGDIVMPHINTGEPMMAEANEFIACCTNKTKPVASGEVGAGVVKTINSMKESLENSGAWVKV